MGGTIWVWRWLGVGVTRALDAVAIRRGLVVHDVQY